MPDITLDCVYGPKSNLLINPIKSFRSLVVTSVIKDDLHSSFKKLNNNPTSYRYATTVFWDIPRSNCKYDLKPFV